MGDAGSSVFDDHLLSTFSRALAVSPHVQSITLGPRSSSEEVQNTGPNIANGNPSKSSRDNDNVNISVNINVVDASTPKKSNKNILQKRSEDSALKTCSFSPIISENVKAEDAFSKKKLLLELESQRKMTVEMVMNERIRSMHDTEKLIHDSLKHFRKAQLEANMRRIISEQKLLDDIHEAEIRIRPQREAKLAQDNLKNAQRIQERKQKVKDAEEEAKRKSEEILKKRIYLDKIFEWQRTYGKEYKDMLETMKSCKYKTALGEATASQTTILRSCSAKCENLIKKCKTGDVGPEDIKLAAELLETLQSVHKFLSIEVKKINEYVSFEFIANEESKGAEATLAETTPGKVEPSDTAENTGASDLSDCFDSQTLNAYLGLRSYLENFEKSCASFMEDNSLKKFRFNCQKAVTIPLNAISPVSASHLSDKFFKLHSLLSGQTVMVGERNVCASQNPLGVAYCKNLLAKKFVRQGDLTVSSKPDAAFAIAAVLVSLWVDFPDFGQLVLSHFQVECPYLAPVFMPQLEGQSIEAYHKSLGYHYTENGAVEKQDSFLKRMSGIMRLYAAVIISKVRQGNRPNPLGMAEGWRWMSAILNLTPRPDICATLLYDFLEVAGHAMFRTYGAQFKKMLFYICQEYFPKLEKVTPASAGGPIVRLEQFLQKILTTESIPPPQGLLPPNFW